MIKETKWSQSSLDRVKKNIRNNRFNESWDPNRCGARPPKAKMEHLQLLGEKLIGKGYSPTEVRNEVTELYELTALSEGRPYSEPCKIVRDRDVDIEMTNMRKTKRPKCNTEARQKTVNAKRTYVSLHVTTIALCELFGVQETGLTILNHDVVEADDDCKTAKPRVLRGRTIISADESRGNTYINPAEVVTRKGTKVSCPPLEGHTSNRVHGYPFVWGCTGAGDKLAPLIGLQSTSDKIRPGNPTILRLDLFAPQFHGNIAPVVVIFHKNDRKELSNLWREHILKPTLEQMKDGLLPGERNIVFMDGGENEYLKPLHEDPNFLAEYEALATVMVKEHVKSSGKLQVCDLLHLFSWIKNPDNWLKHLHAGKFNLHLARMKDLLDDVLKTEAKFDAGKRALLIEALTLLFNVILPNLSERMIVDQWELRGTLPRPTWEGAFQQIPVCELLATLP